MLGIQHLQRDDCHLDRGNTQYNLSRYPSKVILKTKDYPRPKKKKNHKVRNERNLAFTK